MKALKWSAIERIFVQFVQLCIMLFLGRHLGPKVFGLVAMLSIFIAVSQTLVDSGFGDALIQKQDRDDKDYSTVFYSNFVIAVVVYFILFFMSPIIAAFFNEPDLIVILRVLSITIIINSLWIVHRTKLLIATDFKRLALISVSSVLISSIIAVFLVYLDLGVWVLVCQSIIFAFLNMLFTFFVCRWFPSGWSTDSFKKLFSFSHKILAAELINSVFNNLYQIVIGKSYTATELGAFHQAKNLSNIPASTLSKIYQRVSYPILSNVQDNSSELLATYKFYMTMSVSLVFPLMVFFSVIAEELVELVLGKAWSESGKLLSLLCFAYMILPVHSINLNLLKAKGRADLCLRLEVIKKMILAATLFFTLGYGIQVICYGIVLQSYISLIINALYTKSYINLSFIEQAKMIFPMWLVAVIVGFVCHILSEQVSNVYLSIFISFIVYFFIYFLFLKIFYLSIFKSYNLHRIFFMKKIL